jgi:hypothetical protein
MPAYFPAPEKLQETGPRLRKSKAQRAVRAGRSTQQFGGTILTDAVGIVANPAAAISIAASSTSKFKISASASS